MKRSVCWQVSWAPGLPPAPERPLQAAVTRCEGWGWGCGVEASMFLDLPAWGSASFVGQGS